MGDFDKETSRDPGGGYEDEDKDVLDRQYEMWIICDRKRVARAGRYREMRGR